jgi:nucleoside-diphosphate kinase
MNNITFSMLKPNVLEDKQVGQIITIIEKKGFTIKALLLTHLDTNKAGEFYIVHRNRPFYQDMCQYMASGPIIAMVLEKENAVIDFRNLIGATNPADAAPGTIRQLFGKSIDANAIHGSDSNENALQEAQFFFPDLNF